MSPKSARIKLNLEIDPVEASNYEFEISSDKDVTKLKKKIAKLKSENQKLNKSTLKPMKYKMKYLNLKKKYKKLKRDNRELKRQVRKSTSDYKRLDRRVNRSEHLKW